MDLLVVLGVAEMVPALMEIQLLVLLIPAGAEGAEMEWVI